MNEHNTQKGSGSALHQYDLDSDSSIDSLPGSPSAPRKSGTSEVISGQTTHSNAQSAKSSAHKSDTITEEVVTPIDQSKINISGGRDHQKLEEKVSLGTVSTNSQTKRSAGKSEITPKEVVTPVEQSNNTTVGRDLVGGKLEEKLSLGTDGAISSSNNPQDISTNNPLFLPTLEEMTTESGQNGVDDENLLDDRKLSNAFYVDPETLERQINQGQKRYNAAAKVAVKKSESFSDDTPNVLKRLHANWKKIVIGIVALFVIATAVTVPLVLLLGKEEPNVLPEGESHWIECPFKNGVPTKEECETKGCIWRESRQPWPSCYITAENVRYKVADVWEAKKQLLVRLQRQDDKVKLFAEPSKSVMAQLDCTHSYRVGVKITASEVQPDPTKWTIKNDRSKHDCSSDEYDVQASLESGQDFKLAIERKSSGSQIWNSSLGGLMVEDGFLQISNLLPSKYLYGMAENWHSPSLLRQLDLLTWPLFSRSTGRASVKPEKRLNLNSVHPFYISLEDNGTANGVLFKTKYPSEYILLKAPGIVFRTIKQQLEFDVFVGTSPKHISELLHELIGGAPLPPLWALGFHIAPSGFPDQIIDAFRKAKVTVDSVHLSPSLWQKGMVFQSSKITNTKNLQYIKDNNDINWVFTVSPGVYADSEYDAYDEGLRSSAFVRWPDGRSQLPTGLDTPKDRTGLPYNVMFGNTTDNLIVVFFDLQNDGGAILWRNLLKNVKTSDVNYRGILVAENEPFNLGTNQNSTWYSLRCPGDSSDSPPYPTAAAWGHGTEGKLSDGTVCMVGEHRTNNGQFTPHLEVHNSYGMDMALKSHGACSDSERCFVMSHSTAYVFDKSEPPGTICKVLDYADNTWEGMKRSLISVLEFNLLGMPLVAVDVCGDSQDQEDELCGRWLQLSSFFPVTRARFSMKNDQGANEGVLQPSLLDKTTRPSLRLRLSLLPYTYSALYMTQTEGQPLLKPLFYEFPHDNEAKEIDSQFMYGSAIMVAPVLDEESHKKGSLRVYFPDDMWYKIRLDSGERMTHATGYQIIPDIEHIPVFVRAGNIIPFYNLEEDSFNLKTALNETIMLGVFPKEGKASGFLYVDDGGIDSNKTDNFFQFEYNQCLINITRRYDFTEPFPRRLEISRIIIYDWEMYDERQFNMRKTHKAPPQRASSSKQDFTCYPAHDHKILILDLSVDLTADVNDDMWLIDWSKNRVCSQLRSESGCYYVHRYSFQDTT